MAGFGIANVLYEIALTFVAFGLAVSGLDDLLLDIAFHIRRAVRRIIIYRRHHRLTAQQLPSGPEQAVAIFVPAWREADVIAQMLRYLRQSLLYENYRVFLGYYPNDPGTRAAISSLTDSANEWLQPVCIPVNGPTNKADCLNRVYERMVQYERVHGQQFDIVVLHDAEDLVHPLEARVYNHLIPSKAMVQLPVIPLEWPVNRLVGGHYLDEFAEMHGKDLVIREAVVRAIPSAGVGCAFRRSVLDEVAFDQARPFRESSLTEDYDLALRLSQRGEKTIFVQIPAGAIDKGIEDLVATREYFPERLDAAIRQKARWYVGIAFQAWMDHAWFGSWSQKYALWRDRKTIWAALLVLTGYFLMAIWLIWWAVAKIKPETGIHGPTAILETSLLQVLLGANLVFLINRICHRIWAVWRIYGPLHGIMSLIRLPVGNFINALAAIRAIRLYAGHLRNGAPLAWQKTDHAFPDAASIPVWSESAQAPPGPQHDRH